MYLHVFPSHTQKQYITKSFPFLPPPHPVPRAALCMVSLAIQLCISEQYVYIFIYSRMYQTFSVNFLLQQVKTFRSLMSPHLIMLILSSSFSCVFCLNPHLTIDVTNYINITDWTKQILFIAQSYTFFYLKLIIVSIFYLPDFL